MVLAGAPQMLPANGGPVWVAVTVNVVVVLFWT
jgi:hypothetical protein